MAAGGRHSRYRTRWAAAALTCFVGCCRGTRMPLTEDIAWVGKLIDAYAVGADRRGVASRRPQDSGVPTAMQLGQIDAEGWVEWRVLPSTLSEAELTQVENKCGLQLPPLFRAY